MRQITTAVYLMVSVLDVRMDNIGWKSSGIVKEVYCTQTMRLVLPSIRLNDG